MLNLIRAYTPFSVLIFLIAGLVLHSGALINPDALVLNGSSPLYKLLIRGLDVMLHRNAFGYTLLSLSVLMAELLYLNTLLVRHRVFLKPGYVPAFTGLLLSTLLPSVSEVLLWLLVSGCVMIGFSALLSSNSPRGGRRVLFNAGFWFGMAALFSFSALGFVLVLALSLAILRPFKAGEWMVTSLGFCTPFYFVATLFFLADIFPLLQEWPNAFFAIPDVRNVGRAGWTALAGSGALLLTGTVIAMRQAGRSPISVRRIWLIIAIAIVVSLAVATPLSQISGGGALMQALPWIATVVAAPIAAEKKTRFGTFIFYFLIALVIVHKLL